jgi:hypothetical protein
MLGRTRRAGRAGQGRLAKRMGGTYTEAGDVTHCQVTELSACPSLVRLCVCVSLCLLVGGCGVASEQAGVC